MANLNASMEQIVARYEHTKKSISPGESGQGKTFFLITLRQWIEKVVLLFLMDSLDKVSSLCCGSLLDEILMAVTCTCCPAIEV